MLTNYEKEKVIDHLNGKTTYTLPAHLWWGVSTSTPAVDGTGVTEPVGNGYARVDAVGAAFAAASGDSAVNASNITFPEATGSWGTLTYIVAFDAESGGNLLRFGALDAPVEVTSGIFRIVAGDLAISITEPA
jgi:hypothetical protein